MLFWAKYGKIIINLLKSAEVIAVKYSATALKKEFSVSKIYSVHYFEYEKNYEFLGEKHDFWEFVYVDRGEIIATAGEQSFLLKQGEMMFHEPNEFHNLQANGVVAPNLIIVGFECRSREMEYFKKKTINLSESEKHFLSVIIKEASEAFSSPLDATFLSKIAIRDESLFGCEQLISIALEQLLISLRRSGEYRPSKSSTTLMRRLTQDTVIAVTEYLVENIGQKLRFSDVAEFAGLSESSLKSLFRARTGQGVMSYFANMKIERAKILIREGNYNITQISMMLGFDSIHLFSRRFKQIVGMSPTEYSKSVKVDFENVENKFGIINREL